ncbi:MAG TPA: HD domain-containing protein [Ktedonobacterales bacterium]
MTQSPSPRRARQRATRDAASLWSAEGVGRAVWASLPDTAPASAIRDSLYDFIPLGPLELDLLATPAFTRLQGIKQLGFVYRVWPGATHTRFEHSLGVYFLMLRGIRALLASGADKLADLGLTETDARAALAAALLHDIGHYPFSHAIEELGYPVRSHERIGRQIIEESEVAAALERHGLQPDRVASLIDPPRNSPLDHGPAILARLLSGALDVDKLDYLPRDARACNVPYGGVDVTRLLGALRVISTPDGPQLGVSDKGISPLNSLLHARQEMFDNVYWHHTNRAMMAMLLRATQEALLAGAVSGDGLAGHDDASLLALLAGVGMPEGARALVEALRARRPYKTAMEVSARAGKPYQLLDSLFWDQSKRRRVENALATEMSAVIGEPVAPWEILVDIPKPEKWEMNTLITFADPPLGMRPLMTWAEATGQRPDDLGLYERHQRRIRIVCHERWRDLIQASAHGALLAAIERIPAI